MNRGIEEREKKKRGERKISRSLSPRPRLLFRVVGEKRERKKKKERGEERISSSPNSILFFLIFSTISRPLSARGKDEGKEREKKEKEVLVGLSSRHLPPLLIEMACPAGYPKKEKGGKEKKKGHVSFPSSVSIPKLQEKGKRKKKKKGKEARRGFRLLPSPLDLPPGRTKREEEKRGREKKLTFVRVYFGQAGKRHVAAQFRNKEKRRGEKKRGKGGEQICALIDRVPPSRIREKKKKKRKKKKGGKKKKGRSTSLSTTTTYLS